MQASQNRPSGTKMRTFRIVYACFSKEGSNVYNYVFVKRGGYNFLLIQLGSFFDWQVKVCCYEDFSKQAKSQWFELWKASTVLLLAYNIVTIHNSIRTLAFFYILSIHSNHGSQLTNRIYVDLEFRITLPHTAKDPTSSLNRKACVRRSKTCPACAGKHQALLPQMFKHEYNKPNKREENLPYLSGLYWPYHTKLSQCQVQKLWANGTR